jgi:AcrR family transcriptional regulator
MTATALHRSCVLSVVRAVEEGARRSPWQPPTLPWDSDLASAYRSRDALLLALHDHWSRQLMSRIDVALELGADSPETSVAVAWRSALRDQPGVHRLLEAEAGNPVLRRARGSLHAAVAVAAGLATFDDAVATSVAVGERFLASVSVDGSGRSSSRLARVLRRLWDGGPAPDPYPWAA